MKRILAAATALLMAATMTVSVFAAGSVTGVVEIAPVAQETETTYVAADGTVQTGTVQVAVTQNQEVAASSEEVAQIEAVAGEGFSCVGAFDVQATVQKNGQTEAVVRTAPVAVAMNVAVPESATVDEVVVTAYNAETGAWEKLPATAVSYDPATGALVINLGPQYSKVAVAVSYAQPQQQSVWNRLLSWIPGIG